MAATDADCAPSVNAMLRHKPQRVAASSWLVCVLALVTAAVARSADDPLARAEALMHEARQAQVAGDVEKMDGSAEAACALLREHRGPLDDQTLECDRGRVFLWLLSGQGRRALETGMRIADERRIALGPDNRHTLRVDSDVALYLRDVGDLEAALALNRRVLEARVRTLGERDAHTLDSYANLAQVLDELGFSSDALPVNRKAYELSREVIGERHIDTLISGINLAINLNALGRDGEALALVDGIYVAARETLGDDDTTTMAALQSLTVTMDQLGRVEDALPLKQALVERSRRVRGETHRRTIVATGNLAWSYAALGRHALALDTVRIAQDAAQRGLGLDHPETVFLLSREAQILLDAGQPEAALERLRLLDSAKVDRLGASHRLRFDVEQLRWRARHGAKPDAKAVAQLRDLVDASPGQRNEVEVRAMLADAQLAIGDDSAAVRTLRQLRDIVELRREQRPLPPNDQASAQVRPARSYKRLARVEQRLGRTVDAFSSAELAKGRTLLDTLAMRRADRSGVLTAEEADKLAEYASRSTSLDEAVARTQAPEQRAVLEAQRFELAREAASFRAALRERHPKYGHLSRVAPVDLAARRTLPAGGVYVSYLVADDRLLAWTLGRDGPLLAHDLGEAASVLANATAWRLWLSGTARGPLWRLADGGHRFAPGAPDATAVRVRDPRALERVLSQRLLAPLAEALAAARVWIISPDDALSALPFETLRVASRPVIERHEVRYVQTLAIHRLLSERHDAHAQLRERRPLLAIGGARYDTGVADAAARRNADVAGDALDALRIAWPPLPGSLREVESVAAAFPGADVWKGAQASERALRDANRNGRLREYRYLHFATHGYLSPTLPQMTAIVLDQLERGADVDGYVTVAELPGYALASDLTVLSACDSGLGALVQGEGIVGLPFALFIAGNADALVSLWPVYDESTADFMKLFFERVARGEGHASALAMVKRRFASDPNTRAPVHWAGFVLYGAR